jgi:hypothetical protein
MAFSPVPTDWISGWSEDATNITVPIASFPELTAAEADGASGDIRKIAFALLEKLFQAWNGKAAADRPGKWTMSKSASVNTSTGITTVQYVVTFQIATTAQDVAAES